MSTLNREIREDLLWWLQRLQEIRRDTDLSATDGELLLAAAILVNTEWAGR